MTNKKKKRKTAQPRRALWMPDEASPTSRARCTSCGFAVETVRAVETGWSSTDYVGVKYRYCPLCGAETHVRDEAGGQP